MAGRGGGGGGGGIKLTESQGYIEIGTHPLQPTLKLFAGRRVVALIQSW